MENEIILIGENQYELKFNEKTIEVVEAITSKSFMSIVSNAKGMLSLGDLRQYFSNALYSVDGGRIPAVQGSNIFDEVLKTKGYVFVNMLVINTIQRDCPFFFLDV